MGCLHVWVGVVLVHGVGGGGVNRVYYVCICHTHAMITAIICDLTSLHSVTTSLHVLSFAEQCSDHPGHIVPMQHSHTWHPPPMTVCAEYMQDP